MADDQQARELRLELKGFSYHGSETPSLSSLELSVSSEEFLGIMGANGSGKSTLLLILAGLAGELGTIDGTLSWNRVNFSSMDRENHELKIAFVPDDPEYPLSHPTAKDELLFGLEHSGFNPQNMDAEVERLLGLVGLSGYGDRDPMGLSGGQQKRLSIAAALAIQPDFLIVDDPSANLDPSWKLEVFEILRELHRSGVGIIVADQDADLLADSATELLILSSGQSWNLLKTDDWLSRVTELEALGVRSNEAQVIGHRLGLTPEELDGLSTVRAVLNAGRRSTDG